MRSNNPKARLQNALQKAVTKAQFQAQEHATIGWQRSATQVLIDVPGRKNYVYVTRGDQSVHVALNEANVPRSPFLPVRVVLRGNTHVVVGRDNANATVLGSVPDSPYGLPPHPLRSHSDVVIASVADGEVITYDAVSGKWVNAPPSGAVDSVNGQTGVVVLDSDDVAEGVVNLYLTQERVEDFAAASLTGGTHLGVAMAYDDLTGLLILDARTAGDLRYAPIAKGVTNGDAHDHLGGDGGTIAYSSLSGAPSILTQENVEDFVGAMLLGAQTGISVTYSDIPGTLIFDVQTAGDLRYAPLAKGVTNGDTHDHLGGDGGTIAYSSLSGAPTIYTQEQIEDFVGAMVGGTETGISVTYDDATGTLIFDAQTAGDIRYGRLATANSWTQNQTIASTQVSGNSLRVIRNLDAASTTVAMVEFVQDHATDDQPALKVIQDGISYAGWFIRDNAAANVPVFNIVQDNATDDEIALRVQQDGTGNVVAFLDGPNTVFQILDGGNIVANQVGVTGVGFSFNRNLALASTNAAVFEIVQDNAGDDQPVVRIQQDGTGDIFQLFDGATKTFYVKDGGTLINAVHTGSEAASGTLLLESTSHATKGQVIVASGSNVNIGNDPLAANQLSVGGDAAFVGINRYAANANGGGMVFRKSRNASVGSHTIVNSGDELGKFTFQGSDGSAFRDGALIVAKVDGTPGASDMPTRLEFYVTPSGSATAALAGTIKQDGKWGLGTSSPQGILHAFDGTGGALLVTKTGVVGSSVVMIPNGTGDVTKSVNLMGIVYHSAGLAAANISIRVDNNSNNNYDDGAGNRIVFTVALNGELSVARTVGTATWGFSLWCIWQ